MNRALVAVGCVASVSLALGLSACSGGSDSRPAAEKASSPGANQRTASDGGGSLGTAAAKLTDACSVVGDDFVKRLVPGASPPARERFPLRCTYRNSQGALEVTFDNGPAEPVKGAESIAGLAKGGYLERLDPSSKGDVYLTVILGSDAQGFNHNLHITVATHDGNDRKDDAIAIARDILARLK